MKIAKAHGIDGFACNIGKDDYSQKQLDLAYAAAEVVDFELFISFDFNWYHIDEVDAVATMFKRYMDKPKQYKVDGKPFVSTFIGDGFDWGAVEKAVGEPIHSVPFYEPKAENANLPSISGLFSWYVFLLEHVRVLTKRSAWPGQLGNVPVKEEMSDARDLLYMSLTDPIQKDYMAPVSPWCKSRVSPDQPHADSQSSPTLAKKSPTPRTGSSTPRLYGTTDGNRFSSSKTASNTSRLLPGTTTENLTTSVL